MQSDNSSISGFLGAMVWPLQNDCTNLDEIAPEFAGKAKIVKINVDDNQLVAGQFGVRSIPTLLLFKNGQLVATQVVHYRKIN